MTLSTVQADPLLLVEEDVYAARCGDGWVLLDLAQDSYSCLYQTEPDDDVGGALSRVIPAAIISELELSEKVAASSASPFPSLNRLWRDLPSSARVSPPGLLFPFLLALMTAGWRFRGSTTRQLIRSIVPRNLPAGTASHEIGPIVRDFDTLCLFLPFRPQCLFRCYLLLHFLKRLGHGADWVFGVTLFPFEAHCWLAQGDVLIGDDAARVGQYEPIFILPAAGC